MDKVAIVKCSDYSTPNVKDAMMKSFDFFGGVGNFVKKGDRVLIKPNLIVASKGNSATTDAHFIEAAIEIVKEQHAVPLIGDSPAFGSAKGVAKSSGILEILERQGIELVEFSRNARFRKDISISKSVKNFDKIINLPKLKAHNQMGFTGATKNLYGLTKGKVKAWRHFIVRNDLEKFCLMILRINEFVKPTFTLVDAVDIMEETGPTEGPIRRFGFIFSGVNCISIDRVMATCLGIDIHKAPLLHVANKNNYRGVSLDEVEVVGKKIENVRLSDFAFPEVLNDISFTLKRVIRSLFRHLVLLLLKKGT